MHLLHQYLLLGAFASSAIAYTINWSGSSLCHGSQGRIQDVYNLIDTNMNETDLFNQQGALIACSTLEESDSDSYGTYWRGWCAFFSNTGGNIFSKTKLLSMLDYLLQPPYESHSCGSVPINYPLLNNSYASLTVNYIFKTPCKGYCSTNTILSPPNGPGSGYAKGWCTFHILQYQGNSGDGSLTDSISPSVPATTYVDLQILDANSFLIGETWYHESPPSQWWGIPSKLPATFEVGIGASQTDALTLQYNGVRFNTSTANPSEFAWSSNNDGYVNGFRSGSGGFKC